MLSTEKFGEDLEGAYWMVLLCKLTRIHGLLGWKARPLARLLLLSNCGRVSIAAA